MGRGHRETSQLSRCLPAALRSRSSASRRPSRLARDRAALAGAAAWPHRRHGARIRLRSAVPPDAPGRHLCAARARSQRGRVSPGDRRLHGPHHVGARDRRARRLRRLRRPPTAAARSTAASSAPATTGYEARYGYRRAAPAPPPHVPHRAASHQPGTPTSRPSAPSSATTQADSPAAPGSTAQAPLPRPRPYVMEATSSIPVDAPKSAEPQKTPPPPPAPQNPRLPHRPRRRLRRRRTTAAPPCRQSRRWIDHARNTRLLSSPCEAGDPVNAESRWISLDAPPRMA